MYLYNIKQTNNTDMNTAAQLKEQAIAELKAVNFYAESGIYQSLPQIIVDAVEDVRIFGMQYWIERTSTGETVKAIVAKLA